MTTVTLRRWGGADPRARRRLPHRPRTDPGARSSAGFACTLTGAGSKTQGVVVCDQPGTLDFAARNARYVESLPDPAVIGALQRLAPLVS